MTKDMIIGMCIALFVYVFFELLWYTCMWFNMTY